MLSHYIECPGGSILETLHHVLNPIFLEFHGILELSPEVFRVGLLVPTV